MIWHALGPRVTPGEVRGARAMLEAILAGCRISGRSRNSFPIFRETQPRSGGAFLCGCNERRIAIEALWNSSPERVVQSA
jgi:hypothetical protein